MKIRKNNILVNVMLLILVSSLMLVASEITLRYIRPGMGMYKKREKELLPKLDKEQREKKYTIDPELGYRPVLGTRYYTEYGTKTNSSYPIQKRPDVQRVLLLGDSVVKREQPVRALKSVYGEEKYEFWNAGVTGYNTIQEVNFYKKYNYAINPDHVVIFFHNNDFINTPVGYYKEGKIFVFWPDLPPENINPWLFRHSYIYRSLKELFFGANFKEVTAQKIENSLKEIQQILNNDSIRLTVVVLPIFDDYANWKLSEKKHRSDILKILEKLGIRHFDLTEQLKIAIYNGINVQEDPGDRWHPSAEFCKFIAEYLYNKNIF
jgi:hypothetical protein